MGKDAVSVTLDRDNLLWLRGRVAAGASASVSELVDHLVAQARTSGNAGDRAIRSVVGTVDVSVSDPDLLEADTYIRNLVNRSVERPLLVREVRPRKRRARG
jgi:hypothetical protein